METRIAWAFCGSFCTFEKALAQVQGMAQRGWEILPVFSFAASELDTRFGRAADWLHALEVATGHPVITTLQGVEPFGPKHMAKALVIAPCTGTTLAKLTMGISDTPVTLAAKSLLRVGCPVVLCPSTNDGLGASARNLGELLNRKNYYAVPFRQDDPAEKPTSLQSDFARIEETLRLALVGRQNQPMIL